MASISGGHHLALTVRDADRSARFYTDLLSMQVVMSGDDDGVRFRVLMCPKSGWVLGVREYAAGAGDTFNELRTGLDHFAFGVATRAELEAWERELEARGLEYSSI